MAPSLGVGASCRLETDCLATSSQEYKHVLVQALIRLHKASHSMKQLPAWSCDPLDFYICWMLKLYHTQNIVCNHKLYLLCSFIPWVCVLGMMVHARTTVSIWTHRHTQESMAGHLQSICLWRSLCNALMKLMSPVYLSVSVSLLFYHSLTHTHTLTLHSLFKHKERTASVQYLSLVLLVVWILRSFSFKKVFQNQWHFLLVSL